MHDSFIEAVGRVKAGGSRDALAPFTDTYAIAVALHGAPDDALPEIWNTAASAYTPPLPPWHKIPTPIKRFYHVSEWDKLPTVNWLIDLIPDTGITVFFGTEGTGKSLLGLRLANEIAAKGHNTLYMPYEDTPVMYTRQTAHDTYYERDVLADYPLWLMAVDQPTLNQEGAMVQFVDHLAIDDIKPEVIFFDTFRAGTHALDENSTQEVGLVIDTLKGIKDELDCSIVVIHHSGKDKTRGARGSSTITADSDINYEVTVEGGDIESPGAQIKIVCRKNKLGPKPKEQFVDVEHCAEALVAVRGDNIKKQEITGNRAQVYATLAVGARTYTEIAQLSGIPDGSVGKALSELVKSGHVVKEAGKYKRV